MTTDKNIEMTVEDSEIASLLKELVAITTRLSIIGRITIYSLVLSVICLAMYVILRKDHYVEENYVTHSIIVLWPPFMFWLCSLLLTFVSLFAMFLFRSLRNKGLIIYEHVTEEIEWSNKQKAFIKKPLIEIKITISTFLRATDLPFAYGPIGQIFYLFFIFEICIADILILAFM